MARVDDQCATGIIRCWNPWGGRSGQCGARIVHIVPRSRLDKCSWADGRVDLLERSPKIAGSSREVPPRPECADHPGVACNPLRQVFTLQCPPQAISL